MWISLENLDICFYVSSDNYCQKFFSFPNFLMSLSLNSWKFARKISKLKRYDVTDCLKILHQHFTSLMMFQFLEIHLFWLKIENSIKKPPPTAYEIFLISIFNLKQACKIVPTVKFKTRFTYFFHSKLDKVYQVIKSVTILRFERDWDKL